MEGVELVLRHQVDEVLDLLLVEEMARHVQQQPAPAKPRLVLDPHGGHRPRHRLLDLRWAEDLRRQELQQRLRAVEHPRPASAGDHDAIRRNLQAIALAAQRCVPASGGDADGAGLLVCGFGCRHLKVKPGAAPEPLGQLPSDVHGVGRILVHEDRRALLERELACPPLYFERLRDQGDRGAGVGRHREAAKRCKRNPVDGDCGKRRAAHGGDLLADSLHWQPARTRSGPATERCERPDSNRYPLRDWILSPARLPIPPLSR